MEIGHPRVRPSWVELTRLRAQWMSFVIPPRNASLQIIWAHAPPTSAASVINHCASSQQSSHFQRGFLDRPPTVPPCGCCHCRLLGPSRPRRPSLSLVCMSGLNPSIRQTTQGRKTTRCCAVKSKKHRMEFVNHAPSHDTHMPVPHQVWSVGCVPKCRPPRGMCNSLDTCRQRQSTRESHQCCHKTDARSHD